MMCRVCLVPSSLQVSSLLALQSQSLLAWAKRVTNTSTELFDVVSAAASADNPGQALLRAGQAAQWPILALLAACYDDASTLTCMAVWLRCSLHRCCARAAGLRAEPLLLTVCCHTAEAHSTALP